MAAPERQGHLSHVSMEPPARLSSAKGLCKAIRVTYKSTERYTCPRNTHT